jgi:hypothetical protein
LIELELEYETFELAEDQETFADPHVAQKVSHGRGQFRAAEFLDHICECALFTRARREPSEREEILTRKSELWILLRLRHVSGRGWFRDFDDWRF